MLLVRGTAISETIFFDKLLAGKKLKLHSIDLHDPEMERVGC